MVFMEILFSNKLRTEIYKTLATGMHSQNVDDEYLNRQLA